MIQKLLFCSVVFMLLSFYSSAQDSCSLSSNSSFGVNFFQQPQNVSLNVCRRETNACCRPLYDSQIGDGTDAMTSSLATKLHFNRSLSCSQMLQQFSCAQCAYDQQIVLERLGSEDRFLFHLCQDFCDAVYRACGSVPLASNSQIVFDAYSNSTSFCSDILSTSMFVVHLVNRNLDRACWAPSISPCNESFLQAMYGDCVNGQQIVSYYWNPTRDCAAGMSLPTDLTRFCPLACPEGEYLPMLSSTCQPCLPGTTSSNRYCLLTWSQWPEYDTLSTDTYCSSTYLDSDSPLSNCTGWQLRGDHLESGIRNIDGVSSTFVINVELQRDGYVSFRAWVDAEPFYDYLLFYIDGGWVEFIDSRVQPSLYNFSLRAGVHSLQWRYVKDSLFSDGSDTAYLWSIVIGGRQWAADFCVPTESDPCAQNVTIDLRPACGRHDIGWSYLPCNNQSQTYKIYHWIRDCNSNASEAVSLPRPEGPFRCVGGCVEGWYRPFGYTSDCCIKANFYSQTECFCMTPILLGLN
jgi:hypothetical protein